MLDLPKDAIRVFDRDLAAASISKTDDRGHSVDLHAFRHTFGTHRSKGGVRPRTAQAALRHSTLDLNMNVYTDPRLLDVAGAMDALPSLPLDGERNDQRQRATGTCDDHPHAPAHAPMLAPDGGKRRRTLSTAGNPVMGSGNVACAQVSGNGKVRRPSSSGDNRRQKAGEGTRTLNNQLGRLKL